MAWMRGCAAEFGGLTVQGGPFADDVTASIAMLFGPRDPIQIRPPSAAEPDGFWTGWKDPATGLRADFHYGIDLAAPAGTPLLALGYGTVVQTIANDASFGNAIKCEYVDEAGVRWTAIYLHMEQPTTLLEGETVTPGQPLGTLGMTGAATGPHLHMQVWRDDYTIDPLSALVDAESVGYMPPAPAAPVTYPVPDVQWVPQGWGRATNAEGWEHAYTLKARIVKEDAYIGLTRTRREDGWDYFDVLIQDY